MIHGRVERFARIGTWCGPREVKRPVRLARFETSYLNITQPVRDWVLDRFVVKLLVRTILEMSADDATHMAAGISYYALFSIFPLLLFLVATLGFFMETGEVRDQVLEAFSGYFPGSENIIEQNLNAVLGVSGALGLFGVLGLLWSGSAIFGGVSRSINRAWDVHAGPAVLHQQAEAVGDGRRGWPPVPPVPEHCRSVLAPPTNWSRRKPRSSCP